MHATVLPPALADCPPGALGAGGGLEELDQVARPGPATRICEPPGPATTSLRNRTPCLAEALDLGVEVVDDEVDPVPAAGLG